LDSFSVKKVVGTRGNNNLGLLLDGEILVGKVRLDVFLIQLKDLIVADSSGVGEVHDAGEAALGHFDRHGEEFRKNGHRVGNVDHLLVASNLGDEVAGILEVLDNGHAHAEGKDIRELLKEALNHSLSKGVIRTGKVGLVALLEALARTLREVIVVVENATSAKVSHVDILKLANIRKIEASDDVGANSLNLVGFTPINVGATSNTGSVQDVSRLVLLNISKDGSAIFKPSVTKEVSCTLFLKETGNQTSNPSILAVDKENRGGRHFSD